MNKFGIDLAETVIIHPSKNDLSMKIPRITDLHMLRMNRIEVGSGFKCPAYIKVENLGRFLGKPKYSVALRAASRHFPSLFMNHFSNISYLQRPLSPSILPVF
ncbi:hypothetical protein CANARDRAFT_60069 [[Candida] arabinofermentans NRRL YB-2248]|uniref:Uncharacterized protein n=1 Tax=[Candida] arabinofermentans NRRL YB-2248 TaxID=983967 RepID=A0A1E4SYA5_9ASCO|nr:hypothetical protein CANARDRAFT_60069 [[Candida] arabinofermentans NRRL YB-2248]